MSGKWNALSGDRSPAPRVKGTCRNPDGAGEQREPDEHADRRTDRVCARDSDHAVAGLQRGDPERRRGDAVDCVCERRSGAPLVRQEHAQLRACDRVAEDTHRERKGRRLGEVAVADEVQHEQRRPEQGQGQRELEGEDVEEEVIARRTLPGDHAQHPAVQTEVDRNHHESEERDGEHKGAKPTLSKRAPGLHEQRQRRQAADYLGAGAQERVR